MFCAPLTLHSGLCCRSQTSVLFGFQKVREIEPCFAESVQGNYAPLAFQNVRKVRDTATLVNNKKQKINIDICLCKKKVTFDTEFVFWGKNLPSYEERENNFRMEES